VPCGDVDRLCRARSPDSCFGPKAIRCISACCDLVARTSSFILLKLMLCEPHRFAYRTKLSRVNGINPRMTKELSRYLNRFCVRPPDIHVHTLTERPTHELGPTYTDHAGCRIFEGCLHYDFCPVHWSGRSDCGSSLCGVRY